MQEISFKEKLKNITTIILDFDGVLTNGTVWLLPPHEFVRSMHVRDSFAIAHAVKQGIRIAVITGGNNTVVKERMKYLGVNDVFLMAQDKLSVYQQFLNDNSIDQNNVLYMGDDIPDLEPMKLSGLAVCPNDAAEEIKHASDFISPIKGGEGCVRDMIEQVLKVKGLWV